MLCAVKGAQVPASSCLSHLHPLPRRMCRESGSVVRKISSLQPISTSPPQAKALFFKLQCPVCTATPQPAAAVPPVIPMREGKTAPGRVQCWSKRHTQGLTSLYAVGKVMGLQHNLLLDSQSQPGHPYGWAEPSLLDSKWALMRWEPPADLDWPRPITGQWCPDCTQGVG